jgi:hypothetical protein
MNTDYRDFLIRTSKYSDCKSREFANKFESAAEALSAFPEAAIPLFICFALRADVVLL